jgi:hypothetical protein
MYEWYSLVVLAFRKGDVGVWRLTRRGGASEDSFLLDWGLCLRRGLNVSKGVTASAVGDKRQAAMAEPSFILAMLYWTGEGGAADEMQVRACGTGLLGRHFEIDAWLFGLRIWPSGSLAVWVDVRTKNPRNHEPRPDDGRLPAYICTCTV